mmetsp:Transcript_22490/g.15970  ORF Transcript_22490/g.15970 Transcript_22490/m.15970 type:complete len:227 (+) Transcript_22490:190-870(+)
MHLLVVRTLLVLALLILIHSLLFLLFRLLVLLRRLLIHQRLLRRALGGRQRRHGHDGTLRPHGSRRPINSLPPLALEAWRPHRARRTPLPRRPREPKRAWRSAGSANSVEELGAALEHGPVLAHVRLLLQHALQPHRVRRQCLCQRCHVLLQVRHTSRSLDRPLWRRGHIKVRREVQHSLVRIILVFRLLQLGLNVRKLLTKRHRVKNLAVVTRGRVHTQHLGLVL